MTKPNVREAVYRAEASVETVLDRQHEAPLIQIHGTTLVVPAERKFATIESIQTYCEKVLELNWVVEQYSRASAGLTVRERRGQTKAHYERWTRTIAIPPWDPVTRKAWAMREFTVLHEVAHHLDESYEDHGPTFTAILCNLVGGVMSPELAFILRMAYYDYGVIVG